MIKVVKSAHCLLISFGRCVTIYRKKRIAIQLDEVLVLCVCVCVNVRGSESDSELRIDTFRWFSFACLGSCYRQFGTFLGKFGGWEYCRLVWHLIAVAIIFRGRFDCCWLFLEHI